VEVLMRVVVRLWCVFALLVLPTAGCSDGTIPENGRLVVTVSSWDAEAEVRVPLAGAELCQAGTTNCTTTYSSGVATIEVPSDQEIAYTLERQGHASYLYADIVPSGGSQPKLVMLTDQLLASQHARLMSPYPPQGEGEIAIELHPPLAGATFTLVGTTGKAYYVDDERNWSADLTATTSQGRGGFLEVSPGTFQVEIGGTVQGCTPGLGWPGDAERRIEVPIQEGYRTFATVKCAVSP
jgi:hypothetical protein